jgi:hypothetical protein
MFMSPSFAALPILANENAKPNACATVVALAASA